MFLFLQKRLSPAKDKIKYELISRPSNINRSYQIKMSTTTCYEINNLQIKCCWSQWGYELSLFILLMMVYAVLLPYKLVIRLPQLAIVQRAVWFPRICFSGNHKCIIIRNVYLDMLQKHLVSCICNCKVQLFNMFACN